MKDPKEGIQALIPKAEIMQDMKIIQKHLKQLQIFRHIFTKIENKY